MEITKEERMKFKFYNLKADYFSVKEKKKFASLKERKITSTCDVWLKPSFNANNYNPIYTLIIIDIQVQP